VESQAPTAIVKKLEAQVRRALRVHDPYKLSQPQRRNLEALSQYLSDARSYSQDYELAETRDEQLASAKQAKQWLNKVKAGILTASQDDLFTAIEVAHLSAETEQAIANLK
jgi:hypothetical protein